MRLTGHAKTEESEPDAPRIDAVCESELTNASESFETPELAPKWAATSWLCIVAAWVFYLDRYARWFDDVFGRSVASYGKYGLEASIACGLLAMLLGTIAMVQMIRENHSAVDAACRSGMIGATPFVAFMLNRLLK